MSAVTCQISMSLDGFVAGPDQSEADPLGRRGMELHEWAYPADDSAPDPIDAEVKDRWSDGVGAFVMGRNMFTPGRGAWDHGWKGWWGDEPPYHAPVFVLTHHARPPLEMDGGTTFLFVTDGIEAALSAARSAAGSDDVAIAGGASTVRQYLAAGLLDELHLHIVPVLLGAGERLFDDVGEVRFEPGEVVATPAATHVRYRVSR